MEKKLREPGGGVWSQSPTGGLAFPALGMAPSYGWTRVGIASNAAGSMIAACSPSMVLIDMTGFADMERVRQQIQLSMSSMSAR